MPFVWTLVGSVAALYVAFGLLVYLRQAAYVYYPVRRVDLTPEDVNIAYDEVRFRSEDGETLAGWFVPAFGGDPGGHDGRGAETVLFCHGNGGNLSDRLDTIVVFHHWRMNVFIFDYRGYGNSTGKPTEQGTYLDARAAWNYLTEARGIPPDRIALYGRSLGAAVASHLAVDVHPPALIMESTFTSAPDMAAVMFPWLPGRLVCRFRYDNLERIGQVRCPVLIAHGGGDRMIPYAQGRRLYEAANRPKTFVELKGDHNSGGLGVEPAYQREAKAFLMRHLEDD